jgi:hypothetical protein
MRNPLSRGSRRARAAVGALALALPLAVVVSTHASAGVNMVVNAGVEQPNGGFPLCYAKAGSGTNKYSIGTTKKAHSGSTALAVTISSYKNGQRMARIGMSQSCAPDVVVGHQYNIGVWYMSSSPDNVIELYRHDEKKGWVFWMDLKTLKASGHYLGASVRTPSIPSGTDQIAYGVALYGKGTLITDDYSLSDATVKATATTCSAGAACTKGAWQVLPFHSPVRSVHTVLLYNGKILFVAGSGNNPAQFKAGSFESAVYDPTTGKFQVIPTPDDFFCAGHVQLADGNVLILGGNKAYPTANGKVGYEGLNTSYVFDPATEKYMKVKSGLIQGHWYPSATELGNGSVVSYGGLNGASQAAYAVEYFDYNKSILQSSPDASTDGTWLPRSAINGDGTTAANAPNNGQFWGLYPAMILTQNGELFYTGSHVFGNNETPVGPGVTARGKGGAGFLNISNIRNPGAADPMTTVDGLQDTPGGPAGTDMTDQSMSVLLPPAQSQQVFLAGGGNINYNKPGTRLTDLINLNAAAPAYKAGPLLPRGTLSNGKEEPVNDGKMYPSMVLLPNGNVFETGGALINREDPVFEASMINTANLESGSGTVYTEMAHDPVPRGYHSQSLLLPDGRVLSIGNNPGDGSFELRISVYTPPYLFDGARPQIKSVQTNTKWTYGNNFSISSNVPIKSAELLRPAAVTHQSDPNQRFVALPISGSGDTVSVNLTSNHNIAPPGWYMLFVTNGNNVPSVAKWVHVG